MYKKDKDLEKGIAFPVCCSINHIVGHFSPMSDDTTTLSAGDVVKIDLGTHMNGYIATGATTVVCSLDPLTDPIQGAPADVVACANTCFEAALRLIRPGKKISDVAPTLQKLADVYGCQLVEGVMTHQMKQFIIDGEKVVLHRPSPEHRVEDAEFCVGEVYAIDMVVSSGDGRSKVLDEKQTTVYKRDLAVDYLVKGGAARKVMGEVNKRFASTPFSIRALTSAKPGEIRLGLAECVQHGLLLPYPVLHEKSAQAQGKGVKGGCVAQIKGTVLLTGNGTDRITKSFLPPVETGKSVEDEELKGLLATSVSAKKKKKKSKK